MRFFIAIFGNNPLAIWEIWISPYTGFEKSWILLYPSIPCFWTPAISSDICCLCQKTQAMAKTSHFCDRQSKEHVSYIMSLSSNITGDYANSMQVNHLSEMNGLENKQSDVFELLQVHSTFINGPVLSLLKVKLKKRKCICVRQLLHSWENMFVITVEPCEEQVFNSYYCGVSSLQDRTSGCENTLS